MTLNAQLKEFRKQQNLTQKEVAEKLYITRQAVSNWETGKTSPDLETLHKLAELYHVPIETFFKKPAFKQEGEQTQLNEDPKKWQKEENQQVNYINNFRKYIDRLPYAGVAITLLIALLIYTQLDTVPLKGWLYSLLPLLINIAVYIPVKILLKKLDKN